MASLVDHARANGIRIVFVSPQFSTASAEAIASEIGGRVEPIDPLAENWQDNLLDVAEVLVEASVR